MVPCNLHQFIHPWSVLAFLNRYAEVHFTEIAAKSTYPDWIDETQSKYELLWRIVDLLRIWFAGDALAPNSYPGLVHCGHLDSEHAEKGSITRKILGI